MHIYARTEQRICYILQTAAVTLYLIFDLHTGTEYTCMMISESAGYDDLVSRRAVLSTHITSLRNDPDTRGIYHQPAAAFNDLCISGNDLHTGLFSLTGHTCNSLFQQIYINAFLHDEPARQILWFSSHHQNIIYSSAYTELANITAFEFKRSYYE